MGTSYRYFSTGYKYFSENYFSTADVSDGSACQVSHGHLNSNYSDKIIIIDNTPVQKAKKNGIEWLTLVVEVARDLDALTSHNHHFVTWREMETKVKHLKRTNPLRQHPAACVSDGSACEFSHGR